MFSFIVGGGKSDFRKNWRRQNKLFSFFWKEDSKDVNGKNNFQTYLISIWFERVFIRSHPIPVIQVFIRSHPILVIQYL